MNGTDTATIELDEGEAREVINALSAYQYEVSGQDQQQAVNVKELLQREFGFKDKHVQDDDDLLDAVWPSDNDGDQEVQFARTEAAEVVAALAKSEGSSEGEAEKITQLRNRFEERFDLETDAAA